MSANGGSNESLPTSSARQRSRRDKIKCPPRFMCFIIVHTFTQRRPPFYWGKQRIDASSLVNGTFDELYELDSRDRKLKPTKFTRDELFEIIGKSSDVNPVEVDESKDNRNIVDDGKSQSLTRDDIEALKSDGASGRQIIETLVENSRTFKEKTTFSQEKYLKKKKQKYSNLFKIRRPTTRLLVEMFHTLNPLKIM